jgi:predicted NodU family carbamoyl transferase
VLYVVDVQEEKQALLSAITHVDGTGQSSAIAPFIYTLF